jgi:hypothetical protein
MDDFDISKIPPGSDSNEPINPDSGADNPGVSHAPLDLGGGDNNPAPAAKPKPQIKMPAQPTIGATKDSAEKITSSERITGVRTFFTKLHAGAIQFLDEIITKWLKDNPGISIKRTNVITGEIQGKKTEPNIIITVWY